jgi:hypothetical protein
LVGGYEPLTVSREPDMERDEVKELHFITSVNNLRSILERGILSHDRAQRLDHESCANESVQGIRSRKRVPNGLPLHSYANLYFHARNPMMSAIRERTDLVVVRVSEGVLDIQDTVLSDGNAATYGTRFHPSPENLAYLDSALVFAKYWTDENFWPDEEKKRVRNAEVLVPSMVASHYIEGCYVDTRTKRDYCEGLAGTLDVTIRREIFFK